MIELIGKINRVFVNDTFLKVTNKNDIEKPKETRNQEVQPYFPDPIKVKLRDMYTSKYI